MTNPTTFDGTTHREMTDAEFAQWNADAQAAEIAKSDAQTQASLRRSAINKLSSLGLSDDEIASIIRP
jgi:hypothetical protein